MNEPGLLAGRYRLEREAGSGGIGMVYRGTDTRSGAIVAVKVLYPQFARDPDYVRRFHRGARIARQLHSPHIVRVLDDGHDGDKHFLVMEYVEGKTLAQVLQERAKLPEREASAIARQVALALDAAHQQGVVHRDVSPGNILLTKDGTARMSDFDIARGANATRMTRTGLFMGKVHYAAPEALAGRADIRSDLYSLGVVLYELLTGHPPFEADTPFAVMDLHRTAEPPELHELERLGDGRLGGVARCCLAKQPEERFQTPQALLRALAGETSAEETSVSPQVQEQKLRRLVKARRALASPRPGRSPLAWLRRGNARYVLVGGAAVVAVVVAVVGSLAFAGGGSSGEAPSASVTRETGDPETASPASSPVAPAGFVNSGLTCLLPNDSTIKDFPVPPGAQCQSYHANSPDDLSYQCYIGDSTYKAARYESADYAIEGSVEDILEFYAEHPSGWRLVSSNTSSSPSMSFEKGTQEVFVHMYPDLHIMYVSICTAGEPVESPGPAIPPPPEGLPALTTDAGAGPFEDIPVPEGVSLGSSSRIDPSILPSAAPSCISAPTGYQPADFVMYTADLANSELVDFYRTNMQGWQLVYESIDSSSLAFLTFVKGDVAVTVGILSSGLVGLVRCTR